MKRLTNREQQVYDLIFDGYNEVRIAKHLNIRQFNVHKAIFGSNEMRNGVKKNYGGFMKKVTQEEQQRVKEKMIENTHRFSNEQEAQMKQIYEWGFTQLQIAVLFKTDQGTINKILNDTIMYKDGVRIGKSERKRFRVK